MNLSKKGVDWIKMDSRKRIVQANLKNAGGGFSVAYEAQKQIQKEYIFDYYCPDKFVDNDIYQHLMSMGSKCVGEVNCGNRWLKQYYVYKKFYHYLIDNTYDTVHIHADTAWKSSIYFLAAKKARIKKIIVHSHSSGINGHYRVVNNFMHFLTKPIIKNADVKCACSNVAAKWMFGTVSNVNIIHNGVDIEKFKFNLNSREKIRKKYELGQKRVIGHISDFSYPKNPEFIRDIIRVFKNNPNYVFLMVGNSEKSLLKKYIDADETIKNVIFTGSVTNPQDYLCAMDIFILPSRFEGLPMCALEAQVSGLFTIVSNNVTEETECSSYFGRLPLNLDAWIEMIEKIDLNYAREDLNQYLDIEKASSSNMAEQFRKIYSMET